MMFRFAYPCDRDQVPDWVMRELMRRTLDTLGRATGSGSVCRGKLLSRVNYRHDIEHWATRTGGAGTSAERDGRRSAWRTRIEVSAGGSG